MIGNQKLGGKEDTNKRVSDYLEVTSFLGPGLH